MDPKNINEEEQKVIAAEEAEVNAEVVTGDKVDEPIVVDPLVQPKKKNKKNKEYRKENSFTTPVDIIDGPLKPNNDKIRGKRVVIKKPNQHKSNTNSKFSKVNR